MLLVIGGPFGLGATELLIILVIIVAIFGASKLAGIGGALGQGIREFRKAAREDEDNDTAAAPVAPLPPPAASVASATPVAPAGGAVCTNPECRATIAAGAQFCANCGTPVGAGTPATPAT